MQYDETFTIFPATQVSSVVVLNEALNVLLVLEGKPGLEDLWHTPSGRIEQGEHPVEAAKRELFEETSLKNLEPQFLETFLARGELGDIIMRHAFLVRVHSSAKIAPVFTDEIVEARWFTKYEFEQMYESRVIRMHHTKLFIESAFKFVQKSFRSGELT